MSVAAQDVAKFSRTGLIRTFAWLALCVFQAMTISWLYEIPAWFSEWGNPFFYVRQVVVLAIVSSAAFALLAWPRRDELIESWQRAQDRHAWRPALALNLVLFLLLAVATAALTRHAADLVEPPLLALSAWSVLLSATAISLLRIDVAIASAWQVADRFRHEIALALLVGVGVQLLASLSTHAWEPMADTTLIVTKAIVGLYETGAVNYPGERMIRIGEFAVVIDRQCSGYEGIALVCGFLCLYLWLFRTTLRFPRTFLLFPIGIAAIWLLNCVRIALLLSLGAHVSPAMAVHGFHSQAGWIAFLAATLGMMALVHRTTFFVSAPKAAGLPLSTPARTPAQRAGDRAMLAHLAPFMALMLASIVLAAVVPHDRPLYGLKVAGVLIALWLFRDVYRSWTWRVSGEAIVVGLLVGAAWIATDPNPSRSAELATWLESIGSAAAATWLVIRALGAIVTVPIAEELAFRGFLQRWLVSRDFETVSYATISVLAIAVSSLLFGLMHERWIAGALAGVAFAFVMVRTRDLAGPIVAHMVANAAIIAWAVTFRQWSLL